MRELSIVINARIKSTRVPNKLLRPFANTTLFEIALKKLSKIDFVNDIYLGIGDKELIDIAENYKRFKILKRDPKSIKKGTHEQKITFEHYNRIKSKYIMVINPCQPLLDLKTLKFAVDFFMKTNFESYTSVIKTSDWIFDSDGNPITNKNHLDVTSNNKAFYKGCHSFHIINKTFFQKNGYMWNFNSNDPALIEIPNENVHDIDDEEDFKYVEFCYKHRIK